jgi:hypothetical protein
MIEKQPCKDEYNGGFRIWQAPGVGVFELEMIHDARVIFTDGRPPLESAHKHSLGESRGHCEGNTLVVETTNYPAVTHDASGTAAPTEYTPRVTSELEGDTLPVTGSHPTVAEFVVSSVSSSSFVKTGNFGLSPAAIATLLTHFRRWR